MDDQLTPPWPHAVPRVSWPEEASEFESGSLSKPEQHTLRLPDVI